MALALALVAAVEALQPATQIVPFSDLADKAQQISVHEIIVPRTEYVVVRGRREVNVQTAASVVTLQGSAAISIDDVAAAVPGLWMINDQDPGTNILSIRGATTDRLQQASVALVLDGVPLADTELFTPRFYDLQAIEVLKGPQGALFGKNAAGGVIAVYTGKSQPRYVSATVGNGGLQEIEAGGGVDLGSDWYIRASGLWSSADGWIKNTTVNRLVDSTSTKSVRLRLMGSEFGWDLDFKFQWLEEQGGAAWASSNDVTGKNKGRLAGNVLIEPIGDYPGSSKRRWGHGYAKASRDLWQGTLSAFIARDSYAKRWDEELDYRPGALTFFGFPAFPNGIQPIRQPIDIRATTAQLNWVSDINSHFTYQWGAFFQDTDKDRTDDFGPLLFGGPAPRYLTRSRQSSVFGGLGLEVGKHIKLEAQGRFDRDDRAQTILTKVGGSVADYRQETFERFQPRISAQWTDKTNNVYISYGEAFRPGGFNPAPGSNSIWKATYRPEITSSTEIGWKHASNPLKAKFEVAAFSNQVQSFQNYTFIDNQSVTLSIADVEVHGVEAMLTKTIFDSVGLGLSYALADSEIRNFIATDPLLGSPATRNYSGKAVPNAPLDTGKIWTSYDAQLGRVKVSGRLDFNYAGKTFYEIDNVLYSPQRWWTDLNVSARADAWALTLNIQNLTNERWAISAFGQGMTGLLAGLGPGGPFDTFTLNRGRKATLSLRRGF